MPSRPEVHVVDVVSDVAGMKSDLEEADAFGGFWSLATAGLEVEAVEATDWSRLYEVTCDVDEVESVEKVGCDDDDDDDDDDGISSCRSTKGTFL